MEDRRKIQSYTEAKKRNNRKWDAANLDRLSVAAPKGTKERWKVAAEQRRKSLNQFIVDSVEDTVNARNAQQRPQETQTVTAVQDTIPAPQTAQERPIEATEGIPLHTLEQRVRRTLYKHGGNIKKDRKGGGYTVVFEDRSHSFGDFTALLEYARGLDKA